MAHETLFPSGVLGDAEVGTAKEHGWVHVHFKPPETFPWS